MISISYNTNETSVCSLVYHNKEFLDISVSSLDESAPREEVVRRATRSSVRLYREHGKGMDMRFRYPGILKGNKQEDMIRNYISDEDAISEMLKTPFSVNGVVASMIERDNLSYSSYDDLSEPLYMYTDASVTDSRETAASCCLLNNNDQLLLLSTVEIPTRNVSIAESFGGVLGFNLLSSIPGRLDTKWFCDNQNVVDFFTGNRGRSKLIGTGVEKFLDRRYKEVSGIKPKPISGSDNRLADAMAKELRHKEMKDSVSYISPALEDSLQHADVEDIGENMSNVLR